MFGDAAIGDPATKLFTPVQTSLADADFEFCRWMALPIGVSVWLQEPGAGWTEATVISSKDDRSVIVRCQNGAERSCYLEECCLQDMGPPVQVVEGCDLHGVRCMLLVVD